MYMESIGNAHSFLSAAREVALQKPIIVIKAGRTESAAKAAASHTGALAGSDEVSTAAFRRVGVVQVQRMAELFNLAEALAKQPRPKGPNLAIVTNAGGPGVLAIDALIESGGQSGHVVARNTGGTRPTVAAALEPRQSGRCARRCHAAVLRQVRRDHAAGAGVRRIARDSGAASDDRSDRNRAKLTEDPRFGDKPILANWMGGSQVTIGIDILNSHGIPTYAYPESAAELFTTCGNTATPCERCTKRRR